jgi:hypothetical protein
MIYHFHTCAVHTEWIFTQCPDAIDYWTGVQSGNNSFNVEAADDHRRSICVNVFADDSEKKQNIPS